MKIVVAVHGRFHGFDLARELSNLGHDVVLVSNYPSWTMARLGHPANKIRGFLLHGIGSRLANRLLPASSVGARERFFNEWFGRSAARFIRRRHWDVVVAFSGIAKPIFDAINGRATLKVLQRGSSHIAVQRRLLEEEARRSGAPGDCPSDWIVAREQSEYAQADLIQVLSTFALRSFVDSGIPQERMGLLRQGADAGLFAVDPTAAAERARRIRAGANINVLFVGNFCFRKGAIDMAEAARRLAGGRFAFRAVGHLPDETRTLRSQATSNLEFVASVPRAELPAHYRWADVFLLPSIEDGGAVVLFQALGSGIPILATTNCAAPDIVREGQNGWVVPIRSPDAIVERLRWCDSHRPEMAALAERVAQSADDWSWRGLGAQANANISAAWRRRFGEKPVAGLLPWTKNS